MMKNRLPREEPCSAARMVACPVNSVVNNAHQDGPECVARVEWRISAIEQVRLTLENPGESAVRTLPGQQQHRAGNSVARTAHRSFAGGSLSVLVETATSWYTGLPFVAGHRLGGAVRVRGPRRGGCARRAVHRSTKRVRP